MRILNRIKPAYRRDTARFLQIVLYHKDNGLLFSRPSLHLCKLNLIYQQRDTEDKSFHYNKVLPSELIEACRVLRTRVLSHTGGLLDLTPTDLRYMGDYARMYGRPEQYDPLPFVSVDFVHRTAIDFLLNNEEATSFMTRHGLADENICLRTSTSSDRINQQLLRPLESHKLRRKRAVLTELEWTLVNKSDPNSGVHYHRALSLRCRNEPGRLLQRKICTTYDLMADAQTRIPHQEETYLLSCCMPKPFFLKFSQAKLDLLRILLNAGANPMVRIESVGYKGSSAWGSWLHFLLELRDNYMRIYGKSGGLLLRACDVDARISLMQVFDVTKIFLRTAPMLIVRRCPGRPTS